MRLTVITAQGQLQLAGTLFSGKPRIVGIDNVVLEAELTPYMLFVRNEDKPGFIGRLGTKLGEAKINIANFTLGRSKPGANAVALVAVDGAVPASTLAEIKSLPGVVSADLLKFDI
jgi:D-3-phosphoglycerate dehydrogenase